MIDRVAAIAIRTGRTLARPVVAAATAGVLGLVLMVFGPPGGDEAAHLYLTQTWHDHGWQLWDNLWYSGRYAQVNYSLLFYPLAALVGLTAAVVIAVTIAAGAFAALVRAVWPAHAVGSAATFALVVPLGVIAGTYPFLLGLGLALTTLAALAHRRHAVAVVAIILCGLAHPLALAFLLVVLCAVGVTHRNWWRRPGNLVLAATAAGLCAVQVLLMRGFSGGGSHYPFNPLDALAIAGFCGAGLLLTRGLHEQRALRAVFIAYAALATVAFAVSSPMGGNAVRLLLLMGAPLLLLPLSARGFRPRGMAAALLVGVLMWQALPAVAGWRTATESRAQHAEFWYPVIAFLDQHHDPAHRVQVVATADNWEAYHLAGRDIPLARGWFRQDDFPTNEALYDSDLTPARYTSWLRRTAVRYVLLPDEPLDYSAGTEADLLRSGRSGLEIVARLGGWTVYEYTEATSIATPADDIAVARLTGNELVLRASRPGQYRVRVRYTPYWQTRGAAACASPANPWGTILRVEEPGVVRLVFDVRLTTFVGAVLGSQGGCATPDDDAPPPVTGAPPLRAAELTEPIPMGSPAD